MTKRMQIALAALTAVFGMLLAAVYAWLYSRALIGLGPGGYVAVEPSSIRHGLSMAFPFLVWLAGLVLGFCIPHQLPRVEGGHWLVRGLRALPLHFVVPPLAAVVVLLVTNRAEAPLISFGMVPGLVCSGMVNRREKT